MPTYVGMFQKPLWVFLFKSYDSQETEICKGLPGTLVCFLSGMTFFPLRNLTEY